MRLWIDDCRPAPGGWKWAKSVDEAKIHCCQMLKSDNATKRKNVLNIEQISLDHDAGNWWHAGGDYIELLKWLEEKAHTCDWDISKVTFHIHSMNPVGVQNMRAIIQANGWKEIFY